MQEIWREGGGGGGGGLVFYPFPSIGCIFDDMIFFFSFFFVCVFIRPSKKPAMSASFPDLRRIGRSLI